jgi:salicylate biosynthesis isochorismate synthase/menaquinone-specific isochorismate synthase
VTRAATSVAPAREVVACAACRLDDAVDPLQFVRVFADRQRFLWVCDGRDEAVAAVGATATVTAAGPERFADVAAALPALLGDGAAQGVLVGGFAFDGDDAGTAPWQDYPAAQLVLPRLALIRRGGETRLVASVLGPARAAPAGAAQLLERTRTSLERALARGRRARIAVAPKSPPTFRMRACSATADWRDAVRGALADVDAGRLDKLVLARAVALQAGAPLDPMRVVARLRAAHPGCAVFAVAQGASVFVGATPELLARVDGDRLETGALAGSAARGERATEDRARGKALLASVKDRREHAAVVDDLVERLGPLCRRLVVPAAPRLLRTAVVQHLWTPLHGRLRATIGLLEVAGALHPTPAICGVPRAAARAALLARESVARGWYGGCVGWLDAADRRSGELGVAIRTALLRGDRALLHAGAGLVRGSRWEAELDETRLKLRAMLHALLEV